MRPTRESSPHVSARLAAPETDRRHAQLSKAGTLANRVTPLSGHSTVLSVADNLNLLPLFPFNPPLIASSTSSHPSQYHTTHPTPSHTAHHAWRPGWPLAGNTRDSVARAC